jgi:hypothetical protein
LLRYMSQASQDRHMSASLLCLYNLLQLGTFYRPLSFIPYYYLGSSTTS